LGFGWGIHGDKDNVRLLDFFVDICGEEEVSSTSGLYNVKETGFVNWKLISVPCVDLLLVEINNAYANLFLIGKFELSQL
jgi:hypothetical protein